MENRSIYNAIDLAGPEVLGNESRQHQASKDRFVLLVGHDVIVLVPGPQDGSASCQKSSVTKVESHFRTALPLLGCEFQSMVLSLAVVAVMCQRPQTRKKPGLTSCIRDIVVSHEFRYWRSLTRNDGCMVLSVFTPSSLRSCARTCADERDEEVATLHLSNTRCGAHCPFQDNSHRCVDPLFISTQPLLKTFSVNGVVAGRVWMPCVGDCKRKIP